MDRSQLTRTWLSVVICAALGLTLGLLAAKSLTDQEKRFTAQATLAMLPDRNLPLDQVSNFWEVLNRGQATGSAAVVLQDSRWLAPAAAAAGVPRSEIGLEAGAIPETTLITVTTKAYSAKAAEEALNSVLANAVRPAAEVSGPFRLETVVPPDGSAVAMAPSPIQSFGALGIGGLLVGAAAGIFVGRFFRDSATRKSDAPLDDQVAVLSRDSGARRGGAATTDNDSMVEITFL